MHIEYHRSNLPFIIISKSWGLQAIQSKEDFECEKMLGKTNEKIFQNMERFDYHGIFFHGDKRNKPIILLGVN